VDNEKMDDLSMDIEGAELDNLRKIFPRCFVDGKLSVTKLLIEGDNLEVLKLMQTAYYRKEK